MDSIYKPIDGPWINASFKNGNYYWNHCLIEYILKTPYSKSKILRVSLDGSTYIRNSKQWIFYKLLPNAILNKEASLELKSYIANTLTSKLKSKGYQIVFGKHFLKTFRLKRKTLPLPLATPQPFSTLELSLIS